MGERKNHPSRETFQAKTAVQSAFLHQATSASNCSAGIVREGESQALHSKPNRFDFENANKSGGLRLETPLPATRATEKPASKSICSNSRSAFAPFAYLVKKNHFVETVIGATFKVNQTGFLFGFILVAGITNFCRRAV